MKNHFFPFLEIFFFQKQLACLLASKAKLALKVYVVERRSIIRYIHGRTKFSFSTAFSPRPFPIVLLFVLDLARGEKNYRKKNKTKKPKSQLPRTLFGSTTRGTAVMHDGQYQPRPLKQPRNWNFFELVSIASIFFQWNVFWP